ncbi:5993_t:CDS:2 [Racocetra fulgida]|uniref:5993_t:CDS:1 n=1 Tax=Racocetra fulgida TaxID=60492 RepID=A0A9N9ND60_9GLOM|nr:5993_t:CDS:2 [Racocetra fulgida]
MGSSLTLSAWEYVVNELVRVLKPGGYIEICEFDHYWVNEGPKARTALQGNDQLSDLHQEKKMIPLGGWGGKLGEIFLENIKWYARNLDKAVDSLGMSNEKYNGLVNSAITEIESKGNVYDTIHRFWAKKL